jgi:hypothetical protein
MTGGVNTPSIGFEDCVTDKTGGLAPYRYDCRATIYCGATIAEPLLASVALIVDFLKSARN